MIDISTSSRPAKTWHASSRLMTLLLLSALFSGCGNHDGYPHDWDAAVTAPAGQCPDITGTYLISDRISYATLAGHYEETPRTWQVMSLAGNPQVGLEAMVYEINTGTPYEKTIKRSKGTDYQCDDGWLEMPWPGGVALTTEDDAPNDNRQMSKTLSYAKNRAGELVIRTNIARWQAFAVWCGDGCKYVPIPFTRETTYAWSRWSPIAVPAYRPSNLPAPDPDNDAPANESPAGRVVRLLRDIAPVGVRVVSVKPEGDHWIAHFHGNNENLLGMHEALLSTNVITGILSVNVDSRGTVDSHETVDNHETAGKNMYVGLTTIASLPVREDNAAKERERVALAKQLDEERDRVVKLLLPNFPKGMVLTNITRIESGYLAEVRYPDEDGFYELLANAQLSGNFSSVSIKSKKDKDGYGRLVFDVAIVPKTVQP